jgi:cysteine-rich repeat protein
VGSCDVAETCDGTTSTCPADVTTPAGTICRAADGPCDVAETCDGQNGACPADAFQPDGTSCDDGDTCSASDVCTNGTCAPTVSTCGDGTVQDGCGEECDDGNTDDNDGCSATCTVEAFGCASAPEEGCRRPVVSLRAKLQVRDKPVDTKDRIKWKWANGSATAKADFGSPLTSTSFQLCIYDRASNLISRASAPAGGTCAGKPCWKESKKGFVYKDKERTPSGIARLVLKSGTSGKARITLTAKGSDVDMPLVPLATPVTVQLKNGNVCWEAVFSNALPRNGNTFNYGSD